MLGNIFMQHLCEKIKLSHISLCDVNFFFNFMRLLQKYYLLQYYSQLISILQLFYSAFKKVINYVAEQITDIIIRI